MNEQDNIRIFRYPGVFRLESDWELQGYHLAYHTLGRLNESGDNVIWIFHALTASSDAAAWWPGLVGAGKLFDPERYFIVCVNMPGSCYGSVGPLEPVIPGGKPFYHDFPPFTIHDMIRAYQPLRDALGIRSILLGIGGSMGGQQLLEWAVTEPEAFVNIVPIATNAWHSPWAKAFNASQRWCIEADPSWKEEGPEAGIEGMRIARSVALLSYRNYETYALFQSDEDDGLQEEYKAGSYQRYQGEKLARRFNAFSYHRLSSSMDSHHVGRALHQRTAGSSEAGGDAISGIGIEESAIRALGRIRARTQVISVSSDILFPVADQQFLARHIGGAKLSLIDSIYGHDGFLLEYEAIAKEINALLPRSWPVPQDLPKDAERKPEVF